MSYMSTSWRNNKTILLDEVMLFKKIQEHLHVAKGLNLKEKTSIQNIFSQTFFFFYYSLHYAWEQCLEKYYSLTEHSNKNQVFIYYKSLFLPKWFSCKVIRFWS